jgi:hypothetical protein
MFTCMIIFIYEICNQINMYVTVLYYELFMHWGFFDMFYIQWHCLARGIYGINKLYDYDNEKINDICILCINQKEIKICKKNRLLIFGAQRYISH